MLESHLAAELKCFYYKPKHNKFLQLAPFKVEEAYKSPRILIFYDVMSDSEIALIKRMAQPRVSLLFVYLFIYLFEYNVFLCSLNVQPYKTHKRENLKPLNIVLVSPHG